MEEKRPAAKKQPLSKEERSRIAREAATRRWEKARKARAQALRPPKAAPAAARRASKQSGRSSSPREFSSALRTAEKRLAKAIDERAEAMARYAVLSAEIPSLQRIIRALQSPAAPGLEQQYEYAPVSLEQIVGDEPLSVNALQPIPVIPVPSRLHPLTTQSRAQGGAIGVPIEEEDEDEGKFLRDSAVAGGNWV